jgi:hypothetical protein
MLAIVTWHFAVNPVKDNPVTITDRINYCNFIQVSFLSDNDFAFHPFSGQKLIYQ